MRLDESERIARILTNTRFFLANLRINQYCDLA